MKLIYARDRTGHPDVHASPGDDVVSSFLTMNLFTPGIVSRCIEYLCAERAAPDEGVGYEGYVLNVKDGMIVIVSDYGQFPDTAYDFEEFIGALEDYRLWLLQPVSPPG